MMRQLGLAGLLVCGLLAQRAAASDLSGTWKGTVDIQGQAEPVTLHLSVDGAKLTGRVDRENTPAWELSDGKTEGEIIRFTVHAMFDGNIYKVEFQGMVEGDVLQGSLSLPDGSWGSKIELRRFIDESTADFTGTWKGDFDFQGTTVAVTFNFRLVNGTIKGTVEGLPTTPAAIAGARLTGNQLSFTVNTDYDGQTYTLLLRGTPEIGKIHFALGTEDGQWGTTMEANKIA